MYNFLKCKTKQGKDNRCDVAILLRPCVGKINFEQADVVAILTIIYL